MGPSRSVPSFVIINPTFSLNPKMTSSGTFCHMLAKAFGAMQKARTPIRPLPETGPRPGVAHARASGAAAPKAKAAGALSRAPVLEAVESGERPANGLEKLLDELEANLVSDLQGSDLLDEESPTMQRWADAEAKCPGTEGGGNGAGTTTTLGICLEVGGANPRKILSLTPGGPAHLSNQVAVGDEILAVDGTPVSDATVMEVLRKPHPIGSLCNIRLARKTGTIVEVALPRAHAALAKAARKALEALDVLSKTLEPSGVLKGAAVPAACAQVRTDVAEFERRRAARDVVLLRAGVSRRAELCRYLMAARSMLQTEGVGERSAGELQRRAGSAGVREAAAQVLQPPAQDSGMEAMKAEAASLRKVAEQAERAREQAEAEAALVREQRAETEARIRQVTADLEEAQSSLRHAHDAEEKLRAELASALAGAEQLRLEGRGANADAAGVGDRGAEGGVAAKGDGEVQVRKLLDKSEREKRDLQSKLEAAESLSDIVHGRYPDVAFARLEFRCDFVRYAAGNVHANKRTRVHSSIISLVQASCMSALVIWGVRSLCCVVSLTRHASAGQASQSW